MADADQVSPFLTSLPPEQAAELEEQESKLSAAEEKRRRIWDMRARGLSYSAIGKVLGLSTSTVHKHHKASRMEAIRDIDENGWKEAAGEHVKKLTRAQERCLDHLASLETGELDEHGKPKPGTGKKGSLAAAIWMQTYLRAVKDEKEFRLDVGFFPKASEKIDITFKDARQMSLEELQKECASLESHLSRARIVPDRGAEAKRITHTLDVSSALVTSMGKNGKQKVNVDPAAVARGAAKIERMEGS